MKFTRTERAAKADRQSKWDVIEAIAEDAVENDIPISGVDSCVAAKTALDQAGNEHADRTVKQLCLIAKFDYESTAVQRRVWRRYGWSVLGRVVFYGWSQEKAYDFLAGERKTWGEVAAEIEKTKRRQVVATTRALDARWGEWIKKADKLMAEGAALAEDTDADETAIQGGYVEYGYLIYQRLTERKLDAEIRQLLESGSAK